MWCPLGRRATGRCEDGEGRDHPPRCDAGSGGGIAGRSFPHRLVHLHRRCTRTRGRVDYPRSQPSTLPLEVPPLSWPKRSTTYVEFTCEWCGQRCHRSKQQAGQARFCSRSCTARYGLSIRPRVGSHMVPCSACEKPVRVWRHETGRYRLRFCDRACKARYYRENSTSMDTLRDQVWDRDGGKCVDCGGHRYLETHHVSGRANRADNLVLVCKKCHVARHVALRGGLNPNGTRSRSKS